MRKHAFFLTGDSAHAEAVTHTSPFLVTAIIGPIAAETGPARAADEGEDIRARSPIPARREEDPTPR
jgi:hypothetical protein